MVMDHLLPKALQEKCGTNSVCRTRGQGEDQGFVQHGRNKLINFKVETFWRKIRATEGEVNKSTRRNCYQLISARNAVKDRDRADLWHWLGCASWP